MRYIALLRGVNVGGHIVKMDHLRRLFAELGFANVRTYIQSGNVFFDTEDVTDETARAVLTTAIERHLRAAFGYDMPVMLRTVPELERIVAADPFKEMTVTPDMRLCVVFTSQRIPDDLALPLRSPKRDMEIVYTTPHEAYIVWYIVNGRPPAAYNFQILGDKATTRFFHTTAKILAAAQSGA